ncbi:MAG: MFS transporter, partial [Chloroflexi bacterium]|nr:MFS transporter [Chloroflexota bacterium]
MLLLFVVSGLLEVSAWGHVQAFTPLFLEQALGVSRADVPRWTGILAGGPLAIALLLTPLWGILADRYGSKIIILRALFVEAVAYGLVALTQDVWQLLGVRMLVGLTFGGQSIVIATIANLVPARRVGFSIGIYQMTYPVGMAIGPLLGSGLIGLVGLRGMFAVDALVAFTAFSLVWRLFRETPRRRESSAGVFKHLATLAGVVWQTSSIRIIFGLFFLLAGGHALITPFLPVLIGSVYQGDNLALTIGLILAGYGTLAGVGAPLAGRLTDRLGPARTVTFTMAGLGLM